MLVDLTIAQPMTALAGASGLDPGGNGRWVLEHPWRLLALFDRDAALTPLEQARAWVLARPPEDDLMWESVRAGDLAPVTPDWWVCGAAHAMAEGLAYGRTAKPGVPFHPRDPQEAGMLRVVEGVAALFDAPACLMSQGTVSGHTFDLFGLVHDRRSLAVLLVVDED